ncbi:MAG: mechanosensitive ion channel family protein [Bacteroidetes bacterium]|nr:MAG: mechanosensitive ion channel family protein [Bacteroidota bacterium]
MSETATGIFSEKLKDLLLNWGVGDTWTGYLVDFSVLILIFLISIIIYYIVKIIINRILKRLILRSASKWDDHLYEQKVFTRLALLIPALFLQLSMESAISSYPIAIRYMQLGINLYITFILLLVVISFLNAVQKIYSEFEVSDTKPIKAYIQIGKIITLVIGGIILISVLVGKSPITMLAGLGAMSAVLMLIFKDSILGFVAGIQLSANKALQIGDWISAPKFNADGTVFDIALVTVKVRNFDHSVSLVPTYSLITDSFVNWRSFAEAGGRRLKRSFLIDVRTIEPVSDELLASLREKGIPVDSLYHGGEDITNLGLFRRYLAYRLRRSEIINQDATLMVRQLQPAENGLPVEVYAFYNSPDWVAFENFQADFFEHLYAMLSDFDLRAFQRISNITPELEPVIKKSDK